MCIASHNSDIRSTAPTENSNLSELSNQAYTSDDEEIGKLSAKRIAELKEVGD